MSKGMQRQAAFWITMSCLPEYLVLDEPVDGLDPVMRRQVWQVLLDDVSARGTTVLLSSLSLKSTTGTSVPVVLCALKKAFVTMIRIWKLETL